MFGKKKTDDTELDPEAAALQDDAVEAAQAADVAADAADAVQADESFAGVKPLVADKAAKPEKKGLFGKGKAAAAESADAKAAYPAKKGLFGNRKKKSKGLYRIEELEERIASGELDDIDEEAIVSMYMPKRRIQRIAAAVMRLSTLKKVLIILALALAVFFALGFMQNHMGNFTVNLNRLELFRKGVSIADNPDFQNATAKLTAEAVTNGTNISVDDLPSNLNNVNGSHNGRNYVAYTFYIRNSGKEDLDYEAIITLESAAKGAEKAARVEVWKNNDSMIYAAAAADGGNEEGCESFQDNDIVCTYVDEDFKVGYVDKYTVVIWLEGDDPECVDEIIGGEIEFSMKFQAIDHDDTNLFTKFINDIVDTIANNNPISASGNDAPNFTDNTSITWDTRLNKFNVSS